MKGDSSRGPEWRSEVWSRAHLSVMQILPRLDGGPESRFVTGINRVLEQNGAMSTVISHGGAHVREIIADGGRYVLQDQEDKNPLTMVSRAEELRCLLTRIQVDVIHVHGPVPAWIAVFANLKQGIPLIATRHRNYPANAFCEVMWRVDRVVLPNGKDRFERVLGLYRTLAGKEGSCRKRSRILVSPT